MCFFSISCLTKSWKLWLDHDLILIWSRSNGIWFWACPEDSCPFQHFRRARFGIQLQVSAIASRCLGLTKRTTFLRLQHGLTFKGRIQSPSFRSFFLGDFCWFFPRRMMMCPFWTLLKPPKRQTEARRIGGHFSPKILCLFGPVRSARWMPFPSLHDAVVHFPRAPRLCSCKHETCCA